MFLSIHNHIYINIYRYRITCENYPSRFSVSSLIRTNQDIIFVLRLPKSAQDRLLGFSIKWWHFCVCVNVISAFFVLVVHIINEQQNPSNKDHCFFLVRFFMNFILKWLLLKLIIMTDFVIVTSFSRSLSDLTASQVVRMATFPSAPFHVASRTRRELAVRDQRFNVLLLCQI